MSDAKLHRGIHRRPAPEVTQNADTYTIRERFVLAPWRKDRNEALKDCNRMKLVFANEGEEALYKVNREQHALDFIERTNPTEMPRQIHGWDLEVEHNGLGIRTARAHCIVMETMLPKHVFGEWHDSRQRAKKALINMRNKYERVLR